MLFNASKKTINAQQQTIALQASQLEAINRSMAVIEFDLNGIVLAANENFLKTMGYRSEQVLGQPHRQFCLPDYARSGEAAAEATGIHPRKRVAGVPLSPGTSWERQGFATFQTPFMPSPVVSPAFMSFTQK